MRKPVFEVTGDLLCTLIDEKATVEYLDQKMREKKTPEKTAKKELGDLSAWFATASTGSHHTMNCGTFTVNVTKAPRG